jgi:prefoldin beta subunit
MPAEDLERLLADVQAQNQQLQAIMVQKQTIQLQSRETENALAEVEKLAAGDEAFRAVGPILVKASKADLSKELGYMKEEMDIRLKTLEKQEKRIKDALQASQEKLQSLIKGGGMA